MLKNHSIGLVRTSDFEPEPAAGHDAPASRARRFALAALAALALAACASAPPAPADVRTTLAPTGTLRIGVYAGSPTSMVRGPGGEMRGLTVDIGQELAHRLGVPAKIVVFPRLAEVLAAMGRGEVDVTITHATAERAKRLGFTPTVVALELGVLAGPHSSMASLDQMDSQGLHLGVSQGSSSERVLGARLHQTRLVTMPSLQAASAALNDGSLDAFATNKGILYKLAESVPGARMLPGRWGEEHLSLGIPRDHSAGLPFLTRFAASVQAEGLVQRAANRAGLHGVVPVAKG